MERAYAHAIQHLLSKGEIEEKVIFHNLITQLKAQGRLKLLPRIKQELERILAREQKPFVEAAHRDEAEQALTAAKQAGIHADKAHINPSLIHGWRAREGSTLIDRSGKRALIDLYRRITA